LWSNTNVFLCNDKLPIVGSCLATIGIFFLIVDYCVEVTRSFIVLTVGSCVAVTRLPIIGSCVATTRPFIVLTIGSCVATTRPSIVGNVESFSCMDIGVEMDKNGEGMLWDVEVMVSPPPPPPKLKTLSTPEKWKNMRKQDRGLSGFPNTNP
jgi:hypothetical protein